MIRFTTIGVICMVLLSGGVSGYQSSAIAQSDGPEIGDSSVNVSFTGDGTFKHNGQRMFWKNGSATSTVEMFLSEEQALSEVCLSLYGNNSTSSLECQTTRIENGQGSATFDVDLPSDTSLGSHRLRIQIESVGSSGSGTAWQPIFVLSKHGDLDNDGVQNGVEVSRGLNLTNNDSDQDGLNDSQELEGGTDPLDADMDEDGLDDGREQELGTDPNAVDSDGDGVADGVEVDRGMDPLESDTDGDGLNDGWESQFGTDPTDSNTPIPLTAGLIGLATILTLCWKTYRDHWIGGQSGSPSPQTAAETNTPNDTATGESAGPPVTGEPPNGENETTSEPDLELLQPNEQVKRMLEREDGRMRQASITENTDWSKAKVSRVLSDMEEEDAISRFRLGREKIVSLPDVGDEDEIG